MSPDEWLIAQFIYEFATACMTKGQWQAMPTQKSDPRPLASVQDVQTAMELGPAARRLSGAALSELNYARG